MRNFKSDIVWNLEIRMECIYLREGPSSGTSLAFSCSSVRWEWCVYDFESGSFQRMNLRDATSKQLHVDQKQILFWLFPRH